MKNIEQPIAAIYLDGYDFEHNMHSEFRQKVYVEEYGKQINNLMSCSSSRMCKRIANKMITGGGLIGLDDTWREITILRKFTDGILWLEKMIGKLLMNQIEFSY